MKSNASVILIENPLTGNGSVANGLRLSAGQFAKWSLPSVVRSGIGAGVWREATKMVLVRDPLSRFISGCALTCRAEAEDQLRFGASSDFIGLSMYAHNPNHLLNYTPGPRTDNYMAFSTLLEWLDVHGLERAPVWLQPQARWLTSYFDCVLATPNIVEYFNAVVKRHVVRSNRVASDPANPFNFAIAPEHQEMFRRVYAEDIELLDRLAVWSLSGKIRRVSGYCPTCDNNRRAGAFTPLDLTKAADELIADDEIRTPDEVSEPSVSSSEVQRKARKKLTSE